MSNLRYPNIEAERARKGWSQGELAEKLGVSRKTYYNWVAKGRIPLSKISLLSEIFEVSTDYLLGNSVVGYGPLA